MDKQNKEIKDELNSLYEEMNLTAEKKPEDNLPEKKINKRLVFGACVGAAIIGFGATFFMCGGQLETDPPAQTKQELPLDIRKEKPVLKKIDKSDFYMPQYKDNHGVCGIAVNNDGEHVAVTSDGACPTNEALATNYGYEYISLTDSFRPLPVGDSCGTAHLVTEGARIGTKDMAKLRAMAQGELDAVPVRAKGKLCPTQAELSDDITNSVGVPVRFEYNEFVTNVEHFPVFNVSEADYQETIIGSTPADKPIFTELGGVKVTSSNHFYIPKILVTPEAKQICDGDFGNCSLDFSEMSLENEDTHEKYQVKTANDYVLPRFMMTRGAWDVCGGVFTQCDFIPDEEYPNMRGTVVNKITHKSYTSKEIKEILDENEFSE